MHCGIAWLHCPSGLHSKFRVSFLATWWPYIHLNEHLDPAVIWHDPDKAAWLFWSCCGSGAGHLITTITIKITISITILMKISIRISIITISMQCLVFQYQCKYMYERASVFMVNSLYWQLYPLWIGADNSEINKRKQIFVHVLW